MAHLSKADKRQIVANRQDMVKYLRVLSAEATTGNLTGVVQFCNISSVKIDVECLLNRPLTAVESVSLLLTPEDTTNAYGVDFGHAHAVALNMKHTRQLCRTLMRQNRIDRLGSSLAELLGEIEDFEGYAE